MKIKLGGLLKTNKPEHEGEQQISAHKDKSALSYLWYFFLVVCVLIIFSIGIRAAFLYKNSTFTTSSYSILFHGKKPFIIAINRDIPQVSIVVLSQVVGSGRVGQSLELGMPIDGVVTADSFLSSDKFLSLSEFFHMLFQPWNYKYADMTIMDILKTTFLSWSIPEKNKMAYTVHVSKDNDLSGITSSQLYDIFKDQEIINEQLGIEIINDTSTDGLGGKAGGVLKEIGGNVISITSGNEKEQSSILTAKSTITAKRISHILGIPLTQDENFIGAADIKIILGKDFLK